MASQALQIDPEQIQPRSVTGEPPDNSVQRTVPDKANQEDQKEIAVLAYQFWQERGCPAGSDQQDWFRAEQELTRLKRSEEEDFGSLAQPPIVDAAEADPPPLRFPVRSELFQASPQRLLRSRWR